MLTDSRQLGIPSTKLIIGDTSPDCCVTLTQSSPIALMVFEISWFHVKQQTIYDPAAQIRPIGHQSIRIRGYGHHRQKRRELRCRLDIDTAAANPQPIQEVFNPDRTGDTIGANDPSDDAQIGLSTSHHITQTMGTKGAP